VNRTTRVKFPAPLAIRVQSATYQFDEVGDEESRHLPGQLVEVLSENVRVGGAKPSKPPAEMLSVVETEVLCVRNGVTNPVGDNQPPKRSHPDRGSVKLGQLGEAIPIKKTGAQKLHQQKANMVREDGAIPIAGFPLPSPEGAI
jgi:hypothetical protein